MQEAGNLHTGKFWEKCLKYSHTSHHTSMSRERGCDNWLTTKYAVLTTV